MLRRAWVRGAGWGASGAALLLATAGQAALGGHHASIEGDAAHFSARVETAVAGTAHVAVLHPANGGVVREYSDADGTVFAVTWHGPGRPDLRQLLGDSYEAASADMAASVGRRTRRIVRVRHADLVVRSQGRPGAFSGLAYDPRLLPAGVTVDALQ